MPRRDRKEEREIDQKERTEMNLRQCTQIEKLRLELKNLRLQLRGKDAQILSRDKRIKELERNNR